MILMITHHCLQIAILAKLLPTVVQQLSNFDLSGRFVSVSQYRVTVHVFISFDVQHSVRGQ